MPLLKKTKQFVAENIKPEFHDKRLASIEKLKLQQVLKRKNPYLFRAKAVTAAPELVQQVLDAHLSSNEETLFGEFLESMAIFVCGEKFNGIKSASEGIDLEFSRDNQRYAVSVKSGPNWGNSRQIKKMISDFDRIRRIVQQRERAHVICVNGCCYGQDGSPNKETGNYLKLCGQDFWLLISDEIDMYKEIVEPLGFEARQHCDEFSQAYDRVLTLFTKEFIENFCEPNGALDWAKLIAFNSGSKSQWQP
jgi:hypothetical protein